MISEVFMAKAGLVEPRAMTNEAKATRSAQNPIGIDDLLDLKTSPVIEFLLALIKKNNCLFTNTD
jgi:hypothetical protein